MLVFGVESVDTKLPPEERARASKWVSHQAQSIVRKATLTLMVRVLLKTVDYAGRGGGDF